ncbi:hypothetical protein [Vulgatibacter sp.]|uniref:hypothetical protein n=1 Tax=Vulgatibacter sp. TaxID=1971226 RepID=UPI0035683C4C
MDGIQLERKIREAEDRVRALLVRTSADDSYACQTELREAVENLRSLRNQRYGSEEGVYGA